jgi:DNA-binding transcriptional MerR regulator
MPESGQIDIPKRALFTAAEVCELANVQPYVLRSWEAEFPELGVAKTAGGARVYRREDIEQVLRIRHLLLVDGLTLAGARRRLGEELAPVAADVPAFDELIGRNARERLTMVKRGLRSILDLLDRQGGSEEFRLAPPPVTDRVPQRSVPAAASRPKTAQGRAHAAPARPSRVPARRKRSV